VSDIAETLQHFAPSSNQGVNQLSRAWPFQSSTVRRAIRWACACLGREAIEHWLMVVPPLIESHVYYLLECLPAARTCVIAAPPLIGSKVSLADAARGVLRLSGRDHAGRPDAKRRSVRGAPHGPHLETTHDNGPKQRSRQAHDISAREQIVAEAAAMGN